MSKLDAYLSQYFLNARQMALACGLAPDTFQELVCDQLIPGPSYVVTERSTVRSYAFGSLPAGEALDGEYFHPDTALWVHRAQQAIASGGRGQAHQHLKHHFTGKLKAALAELNVTTWHLADCFADDGSELAEGMEKRVAAIWEHFLQGTFGLCVARPVSEHAIAVKEVLQEKLTSLSENGAKPYFAPPEVAPMLALIEQFAESAMPFSPVEYPLSSRKRLVDDLKVRLLKLEAQ